MFFCWVDVIGVVRMCVFFVCCMCAVLFVWLLFVFVWLLVLCVSVCVCAGVYVCGL